MDCRPHSLTSLKYNGQYGKEIQLLPISRLRLFFSWILVSKEILKFIKKNTLNLVISSYMYFKALYDRGSLRLKLALHVSRELKATSPPNPEQPCSEAHG